MQHVLQERVTASHPQQLNHAHATASAHIYLPCDLLRARKSKHI
jgi:hypothetical protein